MIKHLVLFVLAIGLAADARFAQAANFQVGGCLKITNFKTIQAAVTSVPPGSTILVCPGTYPEQVVISQPLILRGQALGPANEARSVITVPQNPAGGPALNFNVTSINGVKFAPQVLVENVNPPGSVQIIDLTVDGAGGNLSCSGGRAGIFYASGTSGAVDGVTTRNQQNTGCGYGIWVENGAGPGQNITIGNDSVHDIDAAGIVAMSNQNPPTLTANIITSSVIGNGTTQGIVAEGISGTINRDVVTGGSLGIADLEFFPQTPGITVTNNVVADVQAGAGIGIALREGSTASSNKVSNVLTAFYLQGGMNANPGPTLLSNTTKNTVTAVEFNCTAKTALSSSDVFGDSQVGFDKVPSGTTNPSLIYNIDTIQTGSCP